MAAYLDFGGITGHHKEAGILPQQDVVDAATGRLDAGDVPPRVRLPDPHDVLVRADDTLLCPACTPDCLSAPRQHECTEVRPFLKLWADLESRNLIAMDVRGGAVHAGLHLRAWALTCLP